jgi:SHAQKYF class myb-like DNA-binding protein
MSLFYNENENMTNLFLSYPNDNNFLITNLKDNYNECINESKEDPQSKQTIKFILTHNVSPIATTSLLQKKTFKNDIDLNTGSSDSNNGRWGKEEQKRFAEAVFKYGNNWKKIQGHISSRNITQVRSHAQKFLMKLKESEFLKAKGLDNNLSWTKAMNFLSKNLTKEELQKVLFSIEQNGQKKNNNGKKNKKNINNENKSESSSSSNQNNESNNNTLFYYDYDMYRNNNFNLNEEEKYKIKQKIFKEDEEEKEMLKKFIECFNYSSDNITLNTSFEDNPKEEENDLGYECIKETQINYNNKFNNTFGII